MTDYPYDLGSYEQDGFNDVARGAQVWFDRGLNWTFAFNHEEAVKCFEKALEHDPNCAMAKWGVAYADGPNYNKHWELLMRSTSKTPSRGRTPRRRKRSRCSTAPRRGASR